MRQRANTQVTGSKTLSSPDSQRRAEGRSGRSSSTWTAWSPASVTRPMNASPSRCPPRQPGAAVDRRTSPTAGSSRRPPDLPDALTTWFAKNGAGLRTRGIIAGLRHSPADGRLKNSAWLTVEAGDRVTQITVWNSGEAEVDLVDHGSGDHRPVHRDFRTEQDLQALLVLRTRLDRPRHYFAAGLYNGSSALYAPLAAAPAGAAEPVRERPDTWDAVGPPDPGLSGHGARSPLVRRHPARPRRPGARPGAAGTRTTRRTARPDGHVRIALPLVHGGPAARAGSPGGRWLRWFGDRPARRFTFKR